LILSSFPALRNASGAQGADGGAALGGARLGCSSPLEMREILHGAFRKVLLGQEIDQLLRLAKIWSDSLPENWYDQKPTGFCAT
jgi:hypothetical protein